MPRRNRPRSKPQHRRGKARLQGLHKKMDSPNVRRADRWLANEGRA